MICGRIRQLERLPLARVDDHLNMLLPPVLGKVPVKVVSLVEKSTGEWTHVEDALAGLRVPDCAAALVGEGQKFAVRRDGGSRNFSQFTQREVNTFGIFRSRDQSLASDGHSALPSFHEHRLVI